MIRLLRFPPLKTCSRYSLPITKASLSSDAFNILHSEPKSVEAVLTKYFVDHAPVTSVKAADPKSLLGSIDASKRTVDASAMEKHLAQAVVASDSAAIKTILNFAVENRLSKLAASCVEGANSKSLPMDEAVYDDLLFDFVGNMEWINATHVIRAKVMYGHRVAPDLLQYTLGGLLDSGRGAVMALELLQSIVERRRSDLVDAVQFDKSVYFSPNLSDSQPIARVMEVALAALTADGWSCDRVAAALLRLSCASGHDRIAADFTRKYLDGLAAHPAAKGSSPHDLLAAASLFSAAIAPGSANGVQQANAAALSLLKEVVERIPQLGLTHAGRDSPLRLGQFVNLYWSLAHRCRGSTLDVERSISTTPANAIDDVHVRTLDLYNQLAGFLGKSETTKVFSLKLGFDRRVFSHLCDLLHLGHDLKGDKFTVTKTEATLSPPPSYSDLLLTDLHSHDRHQRRLDGEPLYWPAVRKHLTGVSDESLQHALMSLTAATNNYYPSISWRLLMVETLQIRRSVPLPPGMLANLIYAAEHTQDVWGLRETLRLIRSERNRMAKSAAYAAAFKAAYVRQRLSLNNDGEAEADESSLKGAHTQQVQENGEVALLSQSALNRLFRVVRMCWSKVPDSVHEELFLEALGEMKHCGAGVYTSVLLEFLAGSRQHADKMVMLARQIVGNPSIEVGYRECVSLSSYLINQVGANERAVSLARLRYEVPNYLVIKHRGVAAVLRHAEDVLSLADTQCDLYKDHHWNSFLSADKRAELHRYLRQFLLTKRDELEYRTTFRLGMLSQIVVYSAYLTSLQDGQHRQAFELLAEMVFLMHGATARANRSSAVARDDDNRSDRDEYR